MAVQDVLTAENRPTSDAEADQTRHFMSTWGDYLTKAGLTDDKKDGKKKRQ
jgi:hypothetical protein